MNITYFLRFLNIFIDLLQMLCYSIKALSTGVAQVVAHQTGGLGVASSSLVTPTKKNRVSFDTLFFIFNRHKT